MPYARSIERLYTSGGGGIGDYSFYGYAPEEPPFYCAGCGAFDQEPCICEPEWMAEADADWDARVAAGELEGLSE